MIVALHRLLIGRTLPALVLFALLFGARGALAHPHIWISANVDLRGEAGMVEALQIQWAFDEMYSALVIQDFDLNGNQRLDPDELRTIEQMSTEALKEVNYFTVLAFADKRQPVESVENLRVRVEDGTLIYSFLVPLPEKTDARKANFGFALYDETYYVDLQLEGRGAVKVSEDTFKGCGPFPTEDQANPIYFGMVYPLLVEIRCKDEAQGS